MENKDLEKPQEHPVVEDAYEQNFAKGVLERNLEGYNKKPAEEPAEKPTDSAEPTEKPQGSENLQEEPQSKGQEQTQTEITDEDLVILADAGLEDKDLENKTVDEIKDLVKQHTKTEPEKPVEHQEARPVLSKEQAEKLGGFAKNLVGKSVEEIATLLNESIKFANQLQSQKTKNEKTKEPDGSDSEIVDLSLLTPEEQRKAIADIARRSVQKDGEGDNTQIAVEEAIKKLLPDIQKVREASVEERVQEIDSKIQSQMPEGYKASEQASKYAQAYKLSDADLEYFDKNPNLFIANVVNFTKAEHNERLANETKAKAEREAKLLRFKATREAIKNLKNVGAHASEVRISSRDQVNDDLDPNIKKILERNTARK